MSDRSAHYNFWYVLFAVMMLLLIQFQQQSASRVDTVPYSEFLELLEAERFESVAVSELGLRGKLRSKSTDGHEYIETVRIEPDFADRLAEYNVEFTGVVESNWLREVLSWVLPTAFFIGIWLFVIRRLAERGGLGSGMMAVGKSKARIYVEKDTRVTFKDVAGVDEAKAELAEIVSFLNEPENYARLGARIPKGTLLVGPPGTGKTLLARAVAGEAGVTFFSINGSEFVEMFVGVGAARVRDLFEQARLAAPCIIFIDELDALGRARGSGPMSGGHDEKEQTLNQLLSELDGFDPSTGIVLLSATNRPEILDPALLRAGRFDRQVLVDRPDRQGRHAILDVHVRKIRLDPAAELEEIAAMTPGFTGADLANLVNEAAIVATRRNASAVTLEDFSQALERIVAGLEKKNRLLNSQERRIIAYHETGHALVRIALPGTESVQKISIIPRGVGALGYTIQRPTEDRYLLTEEELKNKMAVLLGGRAAEMLIFAERSTGAVDDLSKATDIARTMVTRYGMHDELGQVTYESADSAYLGQSDPRWLSGQGYSQETAWRIDNAVQQLVEAAYQRALAILDCNHSELDRIAEQLLAEETLDADDLPQALKLPGVAVPTVSGAETVS